MRRFKLLLVGGFLLLSGLVSTTMPLLVQAVEPNAQLCENLPAGTEVPTVCKDTAAGATNTNNPIVGPEGIVTKILQVVIYATALVSVIVLIIGGIRYAISAGDPNGTKGAKDSIMYALIGLVIALFAQGIVAYVLNKL